MKRIDWLLIGACVIVFAVVAVNTKKAHAHDIYSHLRTPEGGSCCNERKVDEKGNVTGDCFATRGEIRNGEHYAWIPFEYRWVHVPESRVIHQHAVNFEAATLCYNPFTKEVLCYQPEPHGN